MHHVIEGTPQELAPYLAQRPHGKFRLVELEESSVPEPSAPVLSEKAKRLLPFSTHGLPRAKPLMNRHGARRIRKSRSSSAI
jgi:hypothetical protein